MTEREINDAIFGINEAAERGDFESAHSQEDQLRHDFIKWLASVGDAKVRPSANRVAVLAALVLSTEQITFDRHTA